MRLENKVAVITGGGSGIGRASAVRFAREGAKIAIAGRHPDKLEETAKIIREEGGDCLCCTADVRNETQIRRLAERTLEKYGKIDILFNNAGVGYSAPYVMDSTVKTPSEDWDAILSINLRSVFYACKAVLPYMIQKQSGVILNCSSINGV